MNLLRCTGLAAVVLAGAVVLLPAGEAAEPQKKAGPDPQTWDRTVDNAIRYLRGRQEANGGWSTRQSPGVTGLVVYGLLQTGKVDAKDPTIERGLKYIESLINPKAGHIAGPDPKPQLQNYVTCVNLLALTAANRDSYKTAIADAVKFLKGLQWDEGEGKTPDDDFFGGAGYDSKSRPDLSNTQFFVESLRAAGVPENDPALKNALTFISRCQNFKNEANNRPWAGKFNDGSFIYSAVMAQSKASDTEPVGYGSMTYAGIKSMIYCGVSKDDPRIQKAYEWIRKHYSVEENPGMPGERNQWGLYYYYHTMAKCLSLMGVDELVDDKGQKHNWRADITNALAKRQRPDGSWLNAKDRWMEGDPDLDTAYALMALSYCKPVKK